MSDTIVTMATGAKWVASDHLDDEHYPDVIEIHTQTGDGRVIMRGCTDATMERDGKLLAITEEKDLACSRSRPIIVRNPGRDFSVETTEHSTLIEEQAIGEIKK